MKIVTLLDTDFTMKILVAILVGTFAGIAIVISKDTGNGKHGDIIGGDPDTFPTLRARQICGKKHNYTAEAIIPLIMDWGKHDSQNPKDPYFACLKQCLAVESGWLSNDTEADFIGRIYKLNSTQAQKFIDSLCLPEGGIVNTGNTNCSRGVNFIKCGLSVLQASLRGELIEREYPPTSIPKV